MDTGERDALLSHFGSGYMTDAYLLLGCHDEGDGTHSFRVWAPEASHVAVVGDFNGWDAARGGMFHIGGGVWEAILSGVKPFDAYKYRITARDGEVLFKADPYATHAETRPQTASKVYDITGYPWTDGAYMAGAREKDPFSSPINIYEVHLGSWRRHADGTFLSYREMADTLIPYLLEMSYTHVEFLPVTEHPYDPSWGYQVTGYFAPTSRFGTPHDFMYLIDRCHAAGIGVILDFVGAHFPKDAHGLASFDGSFCYESPDTVMNEHPDWGTRIFNYDRYEVRAFLISAICFWLKEYHADGIRMDAVASMLYLDYGRGGGEWHPNHLGGKYNLAAIEFLKAANHAARSLAQGSLMIAEESTAFEGVTAPTAHGGLGFHFKWNMGWMNDTLRYMETDPIFRRHVHGTLTFPFVYAHDENYILPFSHDEVVHLKGAMIGKMPGEYGQRFANLRALYAYMFAFPGKKLNFMGNEFAGFDEWREAAELPWSHLSYAAHRQFSDFMRALHRLYLATPALYERDSDKTGVALTVGDDSDQNVIAFRRIAKNGDEVLALCSFSPVTRENYRVGTPWGEALLPLFSTDDTAYGGRGTPLSPVPIEPIPMHGHSHSASFTLPPMSVTLYTLKKGRTQ